MQVRRMLGEGEVLEKTDEQLKRSRHVGARELGGVRRKNSSGGRGLRRERDGMGCTRKRQ